MKKKLRKLKKLIYSHQVEAISISVGLILCIIGTILLNWLVIPIIVLTNVVIIFWRQIKDFFIKVFKIKPKEKIIKEKKNILERSKENMVKEKKKKVTKKNKNNKKKKFSFKKLLKIVLMMILIGIIFAFIGAVAFWLYIGKNAPTFNEDKLYKKEASILYDKNGEVFAKLGSEFREKITYEELPEVLVNAIIATEDSRFFQHNGFDLPRFIKASIGQVAKKLLGTGGNAGGASTLTMQISKNAFTSTESKGLDGIIRKFTDIYVSINGIEKNYTKEQIIEFYVNSYCLGGSIYGVEQASLSYFGKHAKDLNLSEAAIIAGLFQAPNTYSPIRNPKNATYRRNIVLTLMVRHGYITQEEADLANSIPVENLVTKTSNSLTGNVYQGFIDTVVAEVKKDTGYNPYSTPMEIYTTMDKTKQDIVNAAMFGKTYGWENPLITAGVSVLNTQNGEIAAVGTGRDTSGIGLLNHATFENQTRRQIGSTAKPLYDYGPFIEFNNYSPAYLVSDERYNYTGAGPITNWDGTYQNVITYRQALNGSRNVPALKAFQKVKNSNILDFVTKLGLSPEISNGTIHEAHSIGGYNGESPVTLSAAYAAFGNGGVYNEPHSYTKLIYRDTGEEITKNYVSHQAMKPSTAFIVFDMLVTTSQEAMRGYRNINNWRYAAKTGTTNFTEETKKAHGLASNAINDLWGTALTDEYTISVWYGYDKIDPQYHTRFGTSNHIILLRTLASQIWTRGAVIKQPDSVVSTTVEYGHFDEPKLPSQYTPADRIYTDYFVKGSEPTEVSNHYSQLSNPKNLKSEYEDGVVTLSWDEIATPIGLDREYLTEYYKPYFKNPDFLADYINNYSSYYANNLGGIVYDIYQKEDGELTYIDSTDKDTIDINITSTKDDITYVVKTSWKNLDTMDSTGTITTVNFGNNAGAILTLKLVGPTYVEISKGENYESGIKVLSNNVDVTNKATITYSITDSNKKEVAKSLTSINTLKEGTYTIKYIAKYDGTTKTISRTLKVLGKPLAE